jgi:hypothetical protein
MKTNDAVQPGPDHAVPTLAEPRSTPLPPGWPLWRGRRHLETLNQYLERMAQAGHTEFRLAIQEARPVRGRSFEGHDIRFILHPFGADGDTADFEAPHGNRQETSPGMTAYNVEPISHGMTFEEWAAAVREASVYDEDDGNLYDFFAQGYAAEEMPGVLADRWVERMADRYDD